MKSLLFTFYFLLFTLILSIPSIPYSQTNTARVSFIEGNAVAVRKGRTIPLNVGEIVLKGDRVKSMPGARLEIRLPDGSFVRIAGKSEINLEEFLFEPKGTVNKTTVKLIKGKIWNKVKLSPGGVRPKFEVSTPTAVVGVRGTTYRMNYDSDGKTLVRVYEGLVEVTNVPFEMRKAKVEKITRPEEVSGPVPVAPPIREVTLEEWVRVVKSYQQIMISQDGRPSKIEDFDQKEDLKSDWVKWNLKRDEM